MGWWGVRRSDLSGGGRHECAAPNCSEPAHPRRRLSTGRGKISDSSKGHHQLFRLRDGGSNRRPAHAVARPYPITRPPLSPTHSYCSAVTRPPARCLRRADPHSPCELSTKITFCQNPALTPTLPATTGTKCNVRGRRLLGRASAGFGRVLAGFHRDTRPGGIYDDWLWRDWPTRGARCCK